MVPFARIDALKSSVKIYDINIAEAGQGAGGYGSRQGFCGHMSQIGACNRILIAIDV
jgi:hypothetical protein